MTRKLASVRRISALNPIEGADRIEVATVDGWQVVCQKGLYKEGDLAVYFEIDSWIPHSIAPFLTREGHYPKLYEGVEGQRLKTIKLRGQISQGLLIPTKELFMNEGKPWTVAEEIDSGLLTEGSDLTEILGILKWEKPLSEQLRGKARGSFPTHLVPKTDQERIQNCFRQVEKRENDLYEVTIKLDGSSMTVFRYWDDSYGEDGPALRVCSRNLELEVSNDNLGNNFVAMALRIEEELGHELPPNLAFQGELMGPGIQGNREGFNDYKFFVYDVYDIVLQRYLSSKSRRELCAGLGLYHVPVLESDVPSPLSVKEGLEKAEGPSVYNPIREGLVYKSNSDPSFSFKIISNEYLLKQN